MLRGAKDYGHFCIPTHGSGVRRLWGERECSHGSQLRGVLPTSPTEACSEKLSSEKSVLLTLRTTVQISELWF